MVRKNKLIFVRGLPGSGKSTFARNMIANDSNMVKFEADDSFYDDNGNYNFDPSKLWAAHKICQHWVKVNLADGKDVIVSNTSTVFKEIENYVIYAKRNEHPIEVHTMLTEYGSIHNVPEETMQKMRDRFQSHEYILERINEIN